MKAAGKQIAGVGRVYFWNGGSLWVGHDAGQGHAHSHHAIQISLALDDSLSLREKDEHTWSDFRGAIVLPHCRHQFDGRGTSVAQIFVEPETAPGRALLERFEGERIKTLPIETIKAMVDPLRTAYREARSDDVMISAAQSALALLTGSMAIVSVTDPRIATAIAQMQARLSGPISLSDAAAAAHLSPSRFRHLFIEQTGSVFRAYILWLRLNVAIRAAMSGYSWTAAAHEAGFADSAHLSRTFRRMFGIVPAMLIIAKRQP